MEWNIVEKDFIIWKYSVSHYKTNLNEKFKRFPSIDCSLSGLQRQLSWQRCPDRSLPNYWKMSLFNYLLDLMPRDRPVIPFPHNLPPQRKGCQWAQRNPPNKSVNKLIHFCTTLNAWSAFFNFNFLESNIVSHSHTLMGNNMGFSILLWYADLRKLREWTPNLPHGRQPAPPLSP